MRKKISLLYVLALVGLFLIPASASAQVAGGGGFSEPLSGELGAVVNSKIFSGISVTKKAKAKTPVKTVAKTTNKTSTGKTTVRKTTTNRVPEVPEEPNNLTFAPGRDLGIDNQLASAISKKQNEQAALITIFRQTKTLYQGELRKMGKREDVAWALTFFIVTCVTVYNAAPEPSDPATDNLYDALYDSMNDSMAASQMTDIQKQDVSDKLVYISGLILAGYMSGKQNNDAATANTYRLLAGTSLQSLLKMDPGRMHFTQTGLVVQ